MSHFSKQTIYVCIIAGLILGGFSIASAQFNEQINYQGKLTDESNITVADDSYNLGFRLCTTSDCTGGSNPIWTETHCYSPDNGTTCNGTGTDQRVLITNGLFSVLLGSISSISSVNFDQTLYLEVRVGGSGTTPSWETLTPRKTLGAVPGAFEAKQLGGIAPGSFVRSDTADEVSGLLTVTAVPTGTGVGVGSLYINPASATADYTLLGLAVGGSQKFRLDADGDLVMAGTLGTSAQNALQLSPYGAVAGNTGEIRFLELAASGTNYVGFKAPDAITTNVIWTLPSADGSANQVLQTSGAGVLSWATAGGAPTDATYVTLSTNATLTAERVLTGTTNQITVTDGGANGNVTLSLPQDIHTSAIPQFARMGLGVAADGTNILTATSASTTDLSKTLNISHTGAITGTGYAGYFSKTGASTTNVALYATASGATNNYAAIFDSGNVGIGTTGPDYTLDVYGTLRVKGLSEVSDSFDDETKIATSTNITVSEGQVKLWACGDNVTFTYKGSSVTYGTVLNATTGKCWMDRNLGASQVATAYNDSAAYGDLFQWGRLDDSHQTRTSATTSNLSSADNPGHSNFILAPDSPYDWRSPQNNNLWQGVTGTNNPCPSGWRIPTDTELDNERASWSSQDYNGAFASPLKLTAGGYRYYSSGSLSNVGSYGYYWSSTVSGTYARRLYFYSAAAGVYSNFRASGFSVRCVQD